MKVFGKDETTSEIQIRVVAKKLLLIFVYAFSLNWIWENLHSYLYAHYQNGEITQRVLSRAALFDAILITVLGFLFVRITYFRNRKWYALVFGFIVAILIELYALKTGRWAYNEYMPLIPILETGLTPSIQLGMLSYLIFNIVDSKKKRVSYINR